MRSPHGLPHGPCFQSTGFTSLEEGPCFLFVDVCSLVAAVPSAAHTSSSSWTSHTLTLAVRILERLQAPPYGVPLPPLFAEAAERVAAEGRAAAAQVEAPPPAPPQPY